MAEFIISFCCAFFHLNSCLQHYNLEVARGNRIDAHDILFSPTLIMMIVLLFPANCHNASNYNRNRMQIPQKVKPGCHHHQSYQ